MGEVYFSHLSARKRHVGSHVLVFSNKGRLSDARRDADLLVR
jgi:hypothetical protein